jgi:hypothetical protein
MRGRSSCTQSGLLEGTSPDSARSMMGTAAIEARLNERQKRMVLCLLRGEKLTSQRCEQKFGVTRDTAAMDFSLLMELGLVTRQGGAPFDQLRLCFQHVRTHSSDNRQAKPENRQRQNWNRQITLT